MSPIAVLLFVWIASKALGSGTPAAGTANATGPEVVRNLRDKGKSISKLATTNRNANFSEEIYYADEGSNIGLYVVWPTDDDRSWVIVRVDAVAKTMLVQRGPGLRTDSVAKNALRINAEGNLLPLRMIPQQ